MPTAAHRRSAFAIFDPAYSAREPYPPAPLLPRWLYLRSEYECFLLERMRRDVEEAKLRVGYPGCFHTPFRVIRYRSRRVGAAVGITVSFHAEKCRNEIFFDFSCDVFLFTVDFFKKICHNI